jgi:hypothetical protein
MSHRAEGLNDIFENNVLIRGSLNTNSGTIASTPVDNNDIVNKAYVDTLATNHPHQDVNTTASPTFVNLTTGGLITDVLKATDLTALYINGTTNPLTTASNYTGVNVTRTINTAASTTAYTNYGMKSILTDTHVVNGSPMMPMVYNYAMNNEMTNTSAHSVTPTLMFNENNYACNNRVSRTGTITASKWSNLNVALQNTASSSITYNCVGGVASITEYGLYNSVGSACTVTNGTVTRAATACYAEVSMGTSASSTATVYYGAITSAADINWVYYVGGGTGNNFLGGDNMKTIFGTGQDCSIYYDGTDMILNPNDVGVGVVKIGVTANDTIDAGAYKVGGVAGISATITTAALTGGGTQGSMTFVNGILTAQTQAT